MGVVRQLPNNQGEKHHSAKLTSAKVRAMRKLHLSGKFCISCLAKIYDCKYSTAWDAINYNTWAHLKG